MYVNSLSSLTNATTAFQKTYQTSNVSNQFRVGAVENGSRKHISHSPIVDNSHTTYVANTMLITRDKDSKQNTGNDKIGKEKLILFWTTIYQNNSTMKGNKRFRTCEYSNCAFTSDRSDIEKADAVMFHMYDLAKHTEKDLPSKRWPHQRWVLYGHESAVNANFTTYYDVEFNMTYTYKKDADVFFGHGCFSKRPHPLNYSVVKNHALGKTRLVAWVISHCNAASRRDDYIRELSKFIEVDGYGRCAKRGCTVLEDNQHQKDPKNCWRMISNTYKFYLSFENSLCNGYITEKLWSRLASGKLVPVVLGGSNYSSLLPPNSYIDVRNFTSPKHLARYLRKLDGDDSMYNSYFEWRRNYQLTCAKHQCKLCEYLNTYTKKKVYKNI